MLAIVPTAIFYVVSCCYCWTTSNGLPGILPDILTYKTCVYTPPGFSPGCMDNVTVYPGGTATFNCQVDPRCHIQSLVWYHDAPNGDKRLLKTARNASEPYVHTIIRAGDHHQGRYYCIINNVMGENECSAFLIIRNASNSINRKSIAFITSKQIIIGIVLILHTLLLPAYHQQAAVFGSLLC